jgi:hypothetical protein
MRPALRGAQCERIEDESQRAGQDQEPEERPERALVRFAKRVLGGQPRDRTGIVGLDRFGLPLGEEVRRSSRVVAAQGFLDLDHRVRRREEAHRRIEHRDFQHPHQERVHERRDPRDERRGHEHAAMSAIQPRMPELRSPAFRRFAAERTMRP